MHVPYWVKRVTILEMEMTDCRVIRTACAPTAGQMAPVPRQARLMALAIHFDRLIREGVVETYSEIARLTGACPAWITAIMKLADLPVPEQERLLSGCNSCS